MSNSHIAIAEASIYRFLVFTPCMPYSVGCCGTCMSSRYIFVDYLECRVCLSEHSWAHTCASDSCDQASFPCWRSLLYYFCRDISAGVVYGECEKLVGLARRLGLDTILALEPGSIKAGLTCLHFCMKLNEVCRLLQSLEMIKTLQVGTGKGVIMRDLMMLVMIIALVLVLLVCTRHKHHKPLFSHGFHPR
jgi:hypothetical protein